MAQELHNLTVPSNGLRVLTECLPLSLSIYTHTYAYNLYIYKYICMCVYVNMCAQTHTYIFKI